jgi:hypothetical protein
MRAGQKPFRPGCAHSFQIRFGNGMTNRSGDAKVKLAQLVGGFKKSIFPGELQPVQVIDKKENTMGSIDIAFEQLFAIFASLFGGSSEPTG